MGQDRVTGRRETERLGFTDGVPADEAETTVTEDVPALSPRRRISDPGDVQGLALQQPTGTPTLRRPTGRRVAETADALRAMDQETRRAVLEAAGVATAAMSALPQNAELVDAPAATATLDDQGRLSGALRLEWFRAGANTPSTFGALDSPPPGLRFASDLNLKLLQGNLFGQRTTLSVYAQPSILADDSLTARSAHLEAGVAVQRGAIALQAGLEGGRNLDGTPIAPFHFQNKESPNDIDLLPFDPPDNTLLGPYFGARVQLDELAGGAAPPAPTHLQRPFMTRLDLRWYPQPIYPASVGAGALTGGPGIRSRWRITTDLSLMAALGQSDRRPRIGDFRLELGPEFFTNVDRPESVNIGGRLSWMKDDVSVFLHYDAISNIGKGYVARDPTSEHKRGLWQMYFGFEWRF